MCIPTKEEILLRDIRRLLEVMSEQIVDMGIFWQLNCITGDDELGYPTLNGRLNFVNEIMNHIVVTDDGITPTKNEGSIDTEWDWKFALLYDVCKERALVKLNHPEGDYHIEPAYYNNCFIGWEVQFFDTAEGVEQFIKDHSNYSSYALYGHKKRIPFKFGYYDGCRKVYCTQHTYNKETNTFIECENLYKLTVQGKVDYVVAEDEDFLADCCGSMVDTFETDGLSYHWCPVVIETRHSTKNANVYTYEPGAFKYSIQYDEVEVPIEEKATLCWQFCVAYMDYQLGERVKDEDLCPSCPIRDFQSVLDGLYPVEVDPNDMQDIREHCDTPTKCDFCDFNSEEQNCRCDDEKRKSLLLRKQIRIIDDYEKVKS